MPTVFSILKSIHEVEESQWNVIWQSDYPFTKYAFLSALELSGSVGANSGWIVNHIVAHQGDALVCAMPLFIKSHSYGEYVFDWAWADAYQRCGWDYYPKLLCAIPFTPATGPRLAFTADLAETQIPNLCTELFNFVREYAQSISVSSFHMLFPDGKYSAELKSNFSLRREGTQFHWFNNNYTNFDEYLAEFTSRKRKNLRKEREKVAQQNVEITFLEGRDTSLEDWRNFYLLYHRTYLKRSGRPGYLGEKFFALLAEQMPEHIVLAQVRIQGEIIAGAVYFKDSRTLYGRYWGAVDEFDGLHFETCYYRGIEYAIEHKLKRFDPGAQGEHKIQRGFQPVLTQSYHWVENDEIKPAIERFCREEQEHNLAYSDDARNYLPFKEGAGNEVNRNILLARKKQ